MAKVLTPKEQRIKEDKNNFKKVIEQLQEYLSVRLGWTIDLTIDSETDKYIRLVSQTMSATEKSAGLFRHIITTIFLRLTVWKLDEKHEGRYMVEMSLFYDHPDGGSNGHRVLIRLVIRENISGKNVKYVLREM